MQLSWVIVPSYMLITSLALADGVSLRRFGIGFVRSLFLLLLLSLLLHSTPWMSYVIYIHIAISLGYRIASGIPEVGGIRPDRWSILVVLLAVVQLYPVIISSLEDWAPGGLGDSFFRIGEGYALFLGGLDLLEKRVPSIYPIGYSSLLASLISFFRLDPISLMNAALSLGPLYTIAIYSLISSILVLNGVWSKRERTIAFILALSLGFASPLAMMIPFKRDLIFPVESALMDLVLSPKYRLYVPLQYQIGIIMGLFAFEEMLKGTLKDSISLGIKEDTHRNYAAAWLSGGLALAVHVVDVLPLMALLITLSSAGKINRKTAITFPLFFAPFMRPDNFLVYSRILHFNTLSILPIELPVHLSMVLLAALIFTAVLLGWILKPLLLRVERLEVISLLIWVSLIATLLSLTVPELVEFTHPLTYLFLTIGPPAILYLHPKGSKGTLTITILMIVLASLLIRQDITPLLSSIFLPIAFIDRLRTESKNLGLMLVLFLALLSPFAWQLRTSIYIGEDWSRLTNDDLRLMNYLKGKEGRTLFTCTDFMWRVGFYLKEEIIPKGMGTQIPDLTIRDHRSLVEYVLGTESEDDLRRLLSGLDIRRVVLGPCIEGKWLVDLIHIKSWRDVPEGAAFKKLAFRELEIGKYLVFEYDLDSHGEPPALILSDSAMEDVSINGSTKTEVHLLGGRFLKIKGGIGKGRVKVGSTIPELFWKVEGTKLFMSALIDLDEYPSPNSEIKLRNVMLALRKGDLIFDKIYIFENDQKGIGWVNFTLDLASFSVGVSSSFSGSLYNSSVSVSKEEFLGSRLPLEIGVISWYGPKQLDSLLMSLEDYKKTTIEATKFSLMMENSSLSNVCLVSKDSEILRFPKANLSGELECLASRYSAACYGDLDWINIGRTRFSVVRYQSSTLLRIPAPFRYAAAAYLVALTLLVSGLRGKRRW